MGIELVAGLGAALCWGIFAWLGTLAARGALPRPSVPAPAQPSVRFTIEPPPFATMCLPKI